MNKCYYTDAIKPVTVNHYLIRSKDLPIFNVFVCLFGRLVGWFVDRGYNIEADLTRVVFGSYIV